MKKLLAVGVIVLFFSVSVIPSTGTTDVKQITMPTSNSNTLYVGGFGPGNYTKIQDAIDNASNGDTVFVYDDSSPYYENVVVDKSINLIGEDRKTTVIDSKGISNHVIQINASYVILSGFTIKNSSGYYAGVGIKGENNSIIGNIITKNKYGIILFGVGPHVNSDYNEIIDNIISNNSVGGIRLDDVSYITITGNSICHNNFTGIATLTGSNGGNTISENYVDGNMMGIGISGNKNSIVNNLVTNNNYIGIKSSGDDNIISENTISNQTKPFDAALEIGGFNNTITRNNLFNNRRHGMLSFPSVKIWTFLKSIRYKNNWDMNYWDEPRSEPKVIVGNQNIHIQIPNTYFFIRLPILIPKFNVDFNPAQEPYDMGV